MNLNQKISFIIAKQFCKETFSNKGFFALYFVYIVLLILASVGAWKSYGAKHDAVFHHQDSARQSWENNPDKHPHRMAHFGTFVFREQHPLSIFDGGLESYTGNVIFLEAHKQHSVNFSEASLSTGLIRFGDLHNAMLLQLILSLILFFLGYASVSAEKENGILKIIHAQGVSMRKVVTQKFLGLFFISALFFIPSLISLWSISLVEHAGHHSAVAWRILLLSISYVSFFLIVSGVTVLVSAYSKTSSKSLLILLGAWLLLCVVIPKTAQVVGGLIYPNLSKIEFKEAVEEGVSKLGDGHNPDDPYFNNLRDSVLQVHNVTSVDELPFNYSGLVMSKGEELTAIVFNEQDKKLIQSYRNQNAIANSLTVVNPFLAIKNISMGLSGTDFNTYVHFMSQTESYRYKQSQYLNDLQMKYISNRAKSSEGKVHVVDKAYWKDYPEFEYSYVSITDTLKQYSLDFTALLIWLILVVLALTKFSNRIKILS